MAQLLPITELGNPILRQKAGLIKDPADPIISQLIQDMIATCRASRGVGLAAPQVGHSVQLFILDMGYDHEKQAENEPAVSIINPRILKRSPKKEKDWEGCLSIPGIRGLVPRSTQIEVAFLNETGQAIQATLDGFLARVFQHEFDHLEGIIYLDHMKSMRDLATESEYIRLMNAQAEKEKTP